MKIAITVCHRQVGYPEMWRHLAPLVQATAHAGHQVLQMASEGFVVGQMRSELAQAALDAGCDAVCFVDDDQVFPPESVNRLIAWDAPIVGALYATRIAPYRSTALIGSGPGHYRGLTTEEVQTGGLLDVDVLGMGFTVVQRSVFARLAQPWFRMGHAAGRDVDESVYFCQQAQAAAFPIQVDTGLRIGHLGLIATQFDAHGDIVFGAPSMTAQRVTMPEKVGV